MADGSSEDHTGPKQITDLTFSAPDAGHVDTKKCENKTTERDKVNLSFYIELGASESCEKSVSRGVAADRSAADSTGSQKSCGPKAEESEDRKKRCFDRYDSSESSDSGVAVLSTTESSACSGSDIASPVSPRSPESACSTGSEDAGPARMPPWASDPAPPARRHALAPPAPRRTSAHHRRITEYFNHKMKPQNGIKRDTAAIPNDDTKRKCLPKNGVTHDLEKYISLLSQTLSPKVLLDVNSHEGTRKTSASNAPDTAKPKAAEIGNNAPTNLNGMIDYSRPKDGKEKTHTAINGFNGIRNCSESIAKEKPLNGLNDERKQNMHLKTLLAAPSAITKKLPSINDSVRTAPTTNLNKSPKKMVAQQVNGVVSSTTKLDSRMNGVTCGSNNLSLNIACKPSTTTKKETAKKIAAAMPKRTNRKSAVINDYNKNLTWSKVHNLKQMQVQKQKCLKQNIATNTPVKNTPGEASTAPKMNVPNGVRQVSMTMNGNLANNLANLNVPVTNLQNCHQINIPQPCNGTVTPNNLASFVAVPQNVMLTTLRIPQNGLPPQTINQQNNINAFNRPNVNVSSPSKLNGQFVFPLVQNLNGAVVQIPNLMAKMPNFVLPQNAHIATQRQDHLQSQQAAQFLINGTLLKLTNAMTPTYTNVNKTQVAPTSQSVPVMNKNVQTIPSVGMTVQPKTNFAVNFSHPVLMPQPGFIVTSVPNMNVKETWSYTSNMASASQTTCATQIVHQPATPIVTDFTTQTLHSSSIPIAPVKPPDNPIQGTDPPSSTVKEPDTPDLSLTKCDIPWLSKTVNNNIVPLDSKLPTRPFANVSVLSEKIEELKEKVQQKLKQEETRKLEATNELRKVEEVARREETIFTQITVLKDVSSNVQSTVIEANFSSATTESSESGIGTDKSIDSPSDSQTSKECDEDSSLSLSVSVCSVEAQSCQKSPILKQPKTLRFPPKSAVLPESDRRTSSTDTTSTVTVCMWENCKKEFDSDSDLLEHLQSIHVESQAGKENYVCLWQQCKVRGKPSCSRLWLERHALSHGGSKPFKCIVDGCDRRFSTQVVLERHVNNHFSEASPNAGSSKKTSDSAAKLIRRNGKKLRYRRQPWSARMFDFFDAGMMEGLAYRLSRGTRWRLGGACPLREPPGRHTLTLHAALTATRYNAAEARREALLTYYPPHVIEDEWVPEKEVKRIKRVEISSLPAHTKVFLYEQFCSSYRKAPSPPPAKPHPMPPPRRLPARHCTSSRMLSNLIANKRKERSDCSATNLPVILNEDAPDSSRVSGAKKRKLGRVLGGKPFWPSGR